MASYKPYAGELSLVLLTMVVGILGFWNIYAGPAADPQPHHHLHVATTFGWMGLLLAQISLLARGKWATHRRLGLAVLLAGPLLVASAALLTVHSARSAITTGREDFLIVQNVLGTFCLALVLSLAFALKKRRRVHGALISSTLILFLGPAFFFTLLTFAPPFRIDGPDTFYRFQMAGWTGLAVILVIVIILYLKDRRNNWAYLLVAASYLLGEFGKAMLTRLELIDPLTRLVAVPSETGSFVVSLVVMTALLIGIVLPSSVRKTLKKDVGLTADTAA